MNTSMKGRVKRSMKRRGAVMRLAGGVFGFACCSFFGAVRAAVAEPVGMVCRVVGKPELVSANGGRKPLRLLQRVQAGDGIQCGAGEEAIVVMLAGGQRFKVAGGKATVRANTVEGGSALGGLRGPSARAARALGGTRTGALMMRPAAPSHQKLGRSQADMRDIRNAPGWLSEKDRHFQWQPLEGADAYSFTLFERNDDIAWRERTTQPRVDYPANAPALKTRQPYLWRVVAYGKSGRPRPDTLWGLVTFLSEADSAQLAADEKALKDEFAQNPDDTTPLLMLVELYREYGVLEMALSTLEGEHLKEQPGVREVLGEVHEQLSLYGRALAQGAASSDASGKP